jgi:hypothetical protein
MAWELVLKEGKSVVEKDPFMESVIQPLILSHGTFSAAMSKLLSVEFANTLITSEKWQKLFESAYSEQV